MFTYILSGDNRSEIGKRVGRLCFQEVRKLMR